jgi:hypothetical protein
MGSKVRGSQAMKPSRSTAATTGAKPERLSLSAVSDSPKRLCLSTGPQVVSAANPGRGKPQALQSVSGPASGSIAGGICLWLCCDADTEGPPNARK